MISENNETLISLKDAARLAPTFDGNTVHAGSVWRWCRKGIRGIRLEYVRCGRRIATSESAVHRFFEVLAKLDEASIDVQAATEASERACDELENAGL